MKVKKKAIPGEAVAGVQSECQWESKLVSQTVILRLNTVHILRTSSSTPGHSGFSLSVDSNLQICLLISILPTKINTCGTFCGYLQTPPPLQQLRPNHSSHTSFFELTRQAPASLFPPLFWNYFPAPSGSVPHFIPVLSCCIYFPP